MSSLEALAAAELRRWCYQRAKLRAGRTTPPQREGYTPTNARTYGSAQVAAIDFERCLCCLPRHAQELLLLRFRDRYTVHQCCEMFRCRPAVVETLTRGALEALATILDRAGLLA